MSRLILRLRAAWDDVEGSEEPWEWLVIAVVAGACTAALCVQVFQP